MPVDVSMDLRNQFGPARDQDPRPTCMAFAASDAHAAARPGWIPLSVEWAYYHALQRDGGPPSGGVTMRSMLETLRFDGQPVEEAWPYIAAEITDTAKWMPPTFTSELLHRDSDSLDATLVAIRAKLDAGTPVLMIMSVSSSFDYGWDDDFVVTGAELPDPKRRHAVVAVGHGTREGKPLLLIRNSWGEGWADAGYAWIDFEYLKLRLLQASVLTKEF